jgi:O-antigen/teichoic acid export membrane protein
MNDQILSLGKKFLIYGVGTMLTRFINLLLLPVFTAHLSPSDYGVIALLALLSMVAMPVFNLGMGAAMGPSYFEGNGQNQKSQTVWTTFIILLVSASILVAIGWIFSKQLSLLTLDSQKYGYFVTLTLTGCAFNIISIPFINRIQFQEKAKSFVIITLLSAIASIILSVTTIVFLGWGVEGMVISQLFGQMLTFLLFFIVGARGIPFRYNQLICNELLKIGIPLIPSFAFLFILMQGNRYILQQISGLEQVGIYSVGFSLGIMMNMVVGGFTSAWYPFFMSYMKKQEEAKVLFGRIFTYYVFGFGILNLLFYFAAKPVVLIMTQKAFHDAYIVVGLSATASFFVGMVSLMLPAMYYNKDIAYQSLIQGIATIVAVPINIFLIYKFGILGASIGVALGYFLVTLFQIIWNKKEERRYLKIHYETNRMTKFFVISIIAAIISLIEKDIDVYYEALLSITMLVIILLITYKLLSTSEKLYIRNSVDIFKNSVLRVEK